MKASLAEVDYYGCDGRSWDATGQGTYASGGDVGKGICSTTDYSTFSSYTAPTSWAQEFCDVTAEWDEFDSTGLVSRLTRQRSAHTCFELHTNGKGKSHRRNLFVASATARGVGDYFSPEIDVDLYGYPMPVQALASCAVHLRRAYEFLGLAG